MKSRIVAIFVGILILWSMLILRAGHLQFVPDDRLNTLQSRQFQKTVTLQARRGAIVDSKGRDLAMSTTAYSLYADPKLLENRRAVAKKLAKVLNQPFSSVYTKIKDGSKRFVWIERKLEQDKADVIKEWNLRGLSFVEEWRRVYPNESLLAQTLGFMGSEGQGLEGLELGQDHLLKGNTKKVFMKKDARGRPLINNGLMFTEHPEGHELRLTVDSELQYRLESELQNAMSGYQAEQAFGVILDAKTSAVLALAAAPTFDVNRAVRAPAESRRNKIMTDVFEPGSTMKTFVIAAALRDSLLQPNTKFFCENGSFKVGDRVIREAESREKFGDLTVAQILAVSSNVGTTKIAFAMGSERLRQGLLDFGFGQRSGVDFPGEARGTLHGLPWRPHLLSNVSFGHGMTATSLQIANAYAAIANGGVLNTPYLIQSVRDGETGEVQEASPKPIRRVLTQEQAAQMRAMLVGVTSKGGTGGLARVDGYMVGGKTGTAQKVNPNGRGYLPGAYISSFAGFIPANDPKYVIFIAVDSPKKSYYGSTVAAPIFSRIASYAVRKEGIAPLYLSDEKTEQKKREIIAKNTVGKKEEAKELRLTAEELHQVTDVDALETVPDLMNLSTREVLRRINGRDLNVKFVGRGMVSDIVPAPGSSLPKDREITVILK